MRPLFEDRQTHQVAAASADEENRRDQSMIPFHIPLGKCHELTMRRGINLEQRETSVVYCADNFQII